MIRLLLVLLALAGGVAAGVTGMGAGVERTLAELRQTLRARPASGNLHIVEIDARSIARLDRWPWPRRHHARLVEQLHALGVARIAFDVDFSSRSTPADDRRLAEALARAGGGVILPTFRQSAGAGRGGWIDALPSGALRDHAVLAAVSIDPDADGRVRRAPIGTITADVPRPSLSAAVAGRNGRADESFPIDFAIEAASIPRHSFVDILDGRVGPAALRGKTVLVGATAIEMGDRYAVPRFGVIPGVVIQALAAETLARGVPRMLPWPALLLLAVAFAAAILFARRRWTLAAWAVAAPLLVFGASIWLATLGIEAVVVPALVTLLLASGIAGLRRALRAFDRHRAIDAQTGLPNRIALTRALNHTPAAGVAMLRIAGLEKLAAGLDPGQFAALLVRVSERVALVAGGAPIHRVDGRFLAWAVTTADEEALEQIFATLRATMLAPVEVGGRRVDVALSGGFADMAEGAGKAIDHAALAAEQARKAGIAWRRHHAGERDELDRDLSLMGELEEAIARGDLRVAYQPKLDLRSGRITSVEALVRWQHASRGFIPPDQFIPLAEREGRIGPMTLHVLDTTIADLRAWRDAGTPIAGAVNLSAKLLGDDAYMQALTQRIAACGFDPRLLTIEVTESAAMHDPAGAAERLARLRALGVAISMDDYGTGQSTLSYLQRLPLDELKIDRSFVQHAHERESDAVLVRSTVELAHALGIRVVAEGVEDDHCLAFLRSVQCDYAQGYRISRPVPADALARLLAEQETGLAA